MAEASRKNKDSAQGLINNYQYLMLHDEQKKPHQMMAVGNMKRKRKRPDNHYKSLHANKLVKKTKLSDTQPADCKASEQHGVASALRDSWEVDSGFSSETSPPPSGRSSPCPGSLCPTSLVALDCEMVGTGPGGRRSELARCSIVDYHGNVLYDKYVQPVQPVTAYRTPWSGIRKSHLLNATPFSQAREEVSSL